MFLVFFFFGFSFDYCGVWLGHLLCIVSQSFQCLSRVNLFEEIEVFLGKSIHNCLFFLYFSLFFFCLEFLYCGFDLSL